MPYGVTVSILDFDSEDAGSNPVGVVELFILLYFKMYKKKYLNIKYFFFNVIKFKKMVYLIFKKSFIFKTFYNFR